MASAIDSGGVVRSVRLHLPQGFGVGIVVPDFDLPTTKARAVLPTCYTKEDAIFNLQRASLLIAALGHRLHLGLSGRSGRPASTSRIAFRSSRAGCHPQIARTGIAGLCIELGAGPSILVFFERGHEAVCHLVRQIFAMHGHGADVLLVLEIAENGFELL